MLNFNLFFLIVKCQLLSFCVDSNRTPIKMSQGAPILLGWKRIICVEETASTLTIVFSEKSQVHRMIPKWPWTLKGPRYPMHVLLVPLGPKFRLFHPTIARFPDNWRVGYPRWVQWWIRNFRTKQSLIIEFRLKTVRGVAFSYSHRDPCTRKRKTNL